jgi:hypothetical protein
MQSRGGGDFAAAFVDILRVLEIPAELKRNRRR